MICNHVFHICVPMYKNLADGIKHKSKKKTRYDKPTISDYSTQEYHLPTSGVKPCLDLIEVL